MNATRLFSPLMLTFCAAASAAPATYEIDPAHTYPSFEADHMGGLSVWRGKFDRTTGTIVLDKEAGAGSVEIAIDASSVDFGLEAMDSKAKSNELFDTDRFPQAVYRGKLEGFKKGTPTRVVGDLTLHGVTRPLTLTIDRFKCIPHPMYKREVCGADALGTFKRDDFGMDLGKSYGFSMDVNLRIQVEALKTP